MITDASTTPTPDPPDEPRRSMWSRPERAAPWLISLTIHAIIIFLGFAITWGALALTDDRDAADVIIADFDALTYQPEAAITLDLDDADASAEEPLEFDTPIPAPTTPANTLTPQDLPASTWTDLGAPELPAFLAAPDAEAAAFAGLKATNARDIVYVIDASGSMISSFQIVADELSRSLSALAPPQRFAVILFQQNQALWVTPRGRLTGATPANTASAAADVRKIFPQGRSNPLNALRDALRLEPDVVFLLSVNITGAGEFEVDADDLLRALARSNPIDPVTDARRTSIKCIQFLDPDPLDTLRRIAETHGGPDGFTFLDRETLGLPR